MSAINDMVREFLDESRENLDRLDQDFIALEREMADAPAERLASIFRTIHTIKGTCGFLGLDKLQGVTHVGENLLSKLRDGKLAVTTEIITTLLKLVDAVREMLTNIESTGAEGSGDYSAIVAALGAQSEPTAAADPVATPAAAEPADQDASSLLLQAIAAMTSPSTPATPATPAEAAPPVALPAATAAAAAAAAQPPSVQPKKPEADAEKAPAPAAASTGGTGIRVDVALLDKLMNLVGELVLARNQIVQYSAGQESAALVGPAQRLNLITTELQEGVMKTRMQPIDNIWSKFPRIVRDLSQLCGKQVRVEMEGRSTELDKTIIEAIKDPLTHIIRNSVDHGIETAEKRKAAGKSPEGRLFLRAFHEGGQVNIEIVDDGGGIPPARVKQKAVEKGLITAEQAARMSDREAVNLIFLPGFSTAEQITNVSGRGVGMDVVKTNIERIGGSVDVQSRPGEGTTLRIKIPLTLAIIPALTIASGGERFAIPQVSLLELVRLEEEQARTKIESIGGTRVYRLRGNLLPLVDLGRQLRPDRAAEARDGAVNIVILQAEERQFGLIVDEINDTEEIVVKPLGSLFKGLTTFAGATIMGDGQVALILDVMGLAQRSGVLGRTKDRSGFQAGEQAVAADERQTLLLFQVGERRRMAIPLSQVARLEEFDRAAIEFSGGQAVVQYRGRIMPLLSLGDGFGEAGATDGSDGPAQAIVYTRGAQSVGLLVSRIVDIVQQAVVVESTGARPGVLGSAIVDGSVTELLDAEGVIGQALPDWTSLSVEGTPTANDSPATRLAA